MKITKSNLMKLIKEEVEGFKPSAPMVEQPEADSDAARDLELYITSDADLYRQQYQPIIKNLVNKKARGIYDSEKAVKLFMYLVQNGAKKYTKEQGVQGFDRATRLEVARELRDAFEAEVETGNYDNMLHKKYQVKEEEVVGEENATSEEVTNLEGMTIKRVMDRRDRFGFVDLEVFGEGLGGIYRVYEGNWYQIPEGDEAGLQDEGRRKGERGRK